MKRRLFIQKLSFWGFFLFDIKSALKGIFPSLLAGPLPQSDATTLTIELDNKTSISIPLLWKNQMAYISTVKLAKNLQYHTYFNEAKKKIVLYLPKNKVVVTAANAFIIIDEKTYQMPAPAIWEQNEIHVPVRHFLPLVNRRTTLNLQYNESGSQVKLGDQNVNITGVSISVKENGTVIRINTSKNFQPREVTADMRYGWLHVDLYTGKLDINRIEKTSPAGLVSKVKTFQFPELASIAFFLRKPPLSHEIIHQPESNQILVVLRTAEEISEDRFGETDTQEVDQLEPSDEVKRQLEEERRKWLIDVVIIDPGHGGKDPGTVGKEKTFEKDIVLAIALKLGKIINKELPDVKVLYTRDSDSFIPLQRRTQFANEKNGKIFISIHANSNDNSRASGFETYILGPEKGDLARDVVLKENSVIDFEDAEIRKGYKGINHILATMAQNAFSRQSEYLALLVQQEMEKQLQSLNYKNRGVKQGPFWVMVGATMPNILVETGFLSNAYDRKILKTAAYQHKIAQGIFEGLRRYKQDYESTI